MIVHCTKNYRYYLDILTEPVFNSHYKGLTGADGGMERSTRNSSGDEISNVNFFATTSYTYYKIQ